MPDVLSFRRGVAHEGGRLVGTARGQRIGLDILRRFRGKKMSNNAKVWLTVVLVPIGHHLLRHRRRQVLLGEAHLEGELRGCNSFSHDTFHGRRMWLVNSEKCYHVCIRQRQQISTLGCINRLKEQPFQTFLSFTFFLSEQYRFASPVIIAYSFLQNSHFSLFYPLHGQKCEFCRKFYRNWRGEKVIAFMKESTGHTVNSPASPTRNVCCV